MDKITRELVDMTAGGIPADDMITLRQHARVVDVNGLPEIVVDAEGALIMAKYSPDPARAAAAVAYFEERVRDSPFRKGDKQ